eukprot:UN01103
MFGSSRRDINTPKGGNISEKFEATIDKVKDCIYSFLKDPSKTLGPLFVDNDILQSHIRELLSAGPEMTYITT